MKHGQGTYTSSDGIVKHSGLWNEGNPIALEAKLTAFRMARVFTISPYTPTPAPKLLRQLKCLFKSTTVYII
jgi:hypothetical protein